MVSHRLIRNCIKKNEIKVLLITILIILIAYSGCLSDGNEKPPVTHFSIVKKSDNIYILTLVTQSKNGEYLENVRYHFVNKTGVEIQFGIIALSNISGKWSGIDVTWDDNGANDSNKNNEMADKPESAGGEYSDSRQAQVRIQDIINGFQENKTYQKSEGDIYVSFNDDNLDGNLSNGDYFIIKSSHESSLIIDDSYSFKLITQNTDLYLITKLSDY